jgi:hypothetical protein
MPISTCNSILKGTTVKEFINLFADSSFLEYIMENNLIPDGVGLPTPIDMMAKPNECLTRKRKVIERLEGELNQMEAIPAEELIAKEKEEHARLINTNYLSEENRVKYMTMLDKISKWETKSPALQKLKEKILKSIRESMIVDRYELDVYYLVGYFSSIPEILTEEDILSRIQKKRFDLLKEIIRENEEYEAWKKYFKLKEAYLKDLDKSLKQLSD